MIGAEKHPTGMVSIYIEGLLVQERNARKLMHWAEDFGMRDIAEELNHSFVSKFQENNGQQPWAYHFKDVNGYILIKAPMEDGDHGPTTQIRVSLNETDPLAPTLLVVSNQGHCEFSVEYISSLVALAKYYIVDTVLLGDDSEVQNNGND